MEPRNQPSSRTPAGKVYLVGAGPGDLGLATFAQRNASSEAEVIVYETSGNPEMLDWAREGAKLFMPEKSRLRTL